MVAATTDENKYFQHLTLKELQSEQWAPMPDWPLYAVSTLGRAMSVRVWKNGRQTNRILRPQYNPKTGYLHYRFYTGEGRNYWTAIYAHRAVIATHVGPIPLEECVDHINEVKTDNRLVNIRSTTVAHNLWRSDRHESYAGQMIEMALKLRRVEEWPFQKIADLMGVSHNTVRRWDRGIQKYLKGDE